MTVKAAPQGRSESELQRSEARIRGILDSMYTFVGVFWLDGRLAEVNRAPLEAAGIERADAIDKPFTEIFWLAHSAQAQEQVRDALRRGAAGETSRCDVPVRLRE